MRHIFSWQHPSISEKMIDIEETLYGVYFHCNKRTSLASTDDSLLFKLDKQVTKESFTAELWKDMKGKSVKHTVSQKCLSDILACSSNISIHYRGI